MSWNLNLALWLILYLIVDILLFFQVILVWKIQWIAFFALGHCIEDIPELPLVLTDKIQELKKTKEAVGVLRKLKAWREIEKARNTLFKWKGS